MENPQKLIPGPNRWKRLYPWLALVIAFLLLAPPAAWLWQEHQMLQARAQAASLGSNPALGNPAPIAQSAHFKILGYTNFVGKTQAETFLVRMEKVYSQMIKFLDIPLGNHPITIIVLPACDVSHGGLNYLTINICNTKFNSTMSSIVIHELTHTLMDSQTSYFPAPIIAEGMAEAMKDRFEWGWPFPYTDREGILVVQRRGQLIPMADLRYGVSYNSPNRVLEYLQAGSFASYLIDRYGIATYLRLFEVKSTYESVYNHPYEDLAHDWLLSLKIRNLFQALLLILSGAAILGLVHLATRFGWVWIPAAVIGWLAFTAWAVCCFYDIYPGVGILVASLACGLVAHWRSRLGLGVLWVGGTATLVGFLLAPAVLLFFR